MRLILILIIGGVLISCKKEGCTDPTAVNYDSNADVDDGTCEQPTPTGPQITAFIDGVPFSSAPILDTFYFDSNTVAKVFEIKGGNMSLGPNVEILMAWVNDPYSMDHPQEYIELYDVRFSDENDGYQNGNRAVQFTSIDTVNRLVSGTFESTNADDGNNPPTYHNLTNGVFTNIPY